MDPQHGDGGFSEDEKTQLGQQQSAMIQLQNMRDQQMIRERKQEHELMEAQQKAMIMRSTEVQKEEELGRLQRIALMERQQEQMSGPPAPPRPVAQMTGPPQPPTPMGMPQGAVLMGNAPPQMPGPPQRMSGQPPPQMGGPPQQMGGPPPPQMGGPPPPQMGGPPPPQMGGPPQQMGGPPPPQMGGPPQQMGGPPPPQMGGPPQQMGGPPPPQMGGPPQQMGGPPQQMGGPPQQMGGPPQQMRGPPPPPMGGVRPPMGVPPQQPMGGPPPQQQQMRGPPQQVPGPPPQMTGPPQMRGPPEQVGGPPQQLGPQQGGPPHAMRGMGGPMPQHRGPPEQMGIPPERRDNIPSGGRPQIGSMAVLRDPNASQAQRPGMQPRPPQGPMGGRFGPPGQDQMRGPRPGGPPQHTDRGPPPQQRHPNQPGPGRGQQEDGRPPSLMHLDSRRPPGGNDDRNDDDIDDEDEEEFKLPPALEKVLGFKDARLQEVGVRPEEMERSEQGELLEDDASAEELELENRKQAMLQQQQQHFFDDDDDDDEPTKPTSKKESKNKKRKKKKKRAKQRHAEQVPQYIPQPDTMADDIEIEYVQEELQMDKRDPSYREFSKIFEAFKIAEPEKPTEEAAKKDITPAPVKEKPAKAFGEESSDDDSDSEETKPQADEDKTKLSKKKMKKLNRLSVAELKQLVIRPDVVEMHDVTARDPKLLVHLKATKNTVPVPRHWCFKRKYLQGKRGIEKMPFDLPDFIKNTGIMEMRQALQDKEEAKNLKAKMREKVRPKMGKIDIDYQKLHDAFFKYQTKPKMTIHGDLYYEGKEFETRLKEKKPGDLSDEIRTALGMPLGPNAAKYPPPWLIAMQRYGPPPSYPNLKIAGLNAPIPEACSFGYHAGGWGKPPVDETGKPLYGDVFGQSLSEAPVPKEEEEVDNTLWGELESESEEDESDESESEDDREMDAEASGLITPGDPGLITPSGVTSVPVGVETPDMIELRKKRIEDAMDQGGDTPALYQVLKEKSAAVGASMMGSAHVYDIQAGKKVGDSAEGVEVALNPDELDLDTAAIQAKYDQQMRESQLEKEDLSDMVADHQAKQSKKRKKQIQQDSKTAKKYKEFKF